MEGHRLRLLVRGVLVAADDAQHVIVYALRESQGVCRLLRALG